MKTRLSRRGSEALLAAVIVARSTSLLLLKLGLADIGTFTLMALRFTTAGAILLLLFHRRIRAAGRAAALRGMAIGAVFFAVLAVVCTVFGFTLQPVAQSGTTAERAAMFCALSPLSASALGVIFLDEQLGLAGVCGAALILCGILLPNILALRHRPTNGA